LNYRKNLSDASIYFTSRGWQTYLDALSISQEMREIITRRYTSSAVPTGTPTITDQGLINGVYSWKVQVPIMIKRVAGLEERRVAQVVDLMIVREPVNNNPQGIGILYYQARGA